MRKTDKSIRILSLIKVKSNLPKVFLGKDNLKISNKFTGEPPCQSVISIKLLCRKPLPKNNPGGLLIRADPYWSLQLSACKTFQSLNIVCHYNLWSLINQYHSNVPLPSPLESVRKPLVFWRVQGVSKWNTGVKWVNPKQSRSSFPEVFRRKGVLKNSANFTRKHLCQSLFFNRVAGLMPATLLKKRLWHRCFPVNFSKFLKAPFFTEHLRWLLLAKIKFNT